MCWLLLITIITTEYVTMFLLSVLKVKLALKQFTKALDEGGWSTPRPGRFTPGKNMALFI